MSEALPADHHPEKCVCWKDGTWETESIPPVCKAYEQAYGERNCINCEHDEACHV